MATQTSKDVLTQMQQEFDKGYIPLQIFNDPELYAMELEKIFAKSWVFVGHESEIRKPGDFVTRYIGGDPFILSRGKNDEIKCLFNSCRHRGVKVCHSEKGNASHFRCPYHGWTYDCSGELTTVPQKERAYRNLEQKEWGLLEARVDSYKGMIFACLDEKAGTLEEHLGGFRWYMDTHIDFVEGGMEVVGEPHRWIVDSDWKIGADNFSGDSYHTQMAHRSVFDLGLGVPPWEQLRKKNHEVHVTDCDGHSTSLKLTAPDVSPFRGYPEEVQALFRKDMPVEQFEIVRRSLVNTGNIFPNLSFVHIYTTDAPNKTFTPVLSFRQWQPRGSGKMEIWSWVLVPAKASEEFKKRSYKVAVSTFSPSGNFEQDDIAIWNGLSATAGSVYSRKNDVKLNYQMGYDFMSDAEVITEWAGPGVVYDSRLEEGVMRTFHRKWLEYMLSE
ncbi:MULTISPECIES: aromatic ring-hydroxylating dioxygenase subunit alpha [unclassified Paenibacillus]|uniref:aromatic ring-hydroxylating oxygenase subunit alpha n=1 Tax=unclassified Paenibacillus TaxID=185978 RepID=UPI001AE0FCB9|nr:MULTISPECIES: aromatic ring-hydroxylating dioxygenase subunit alpha [unclassified Paenibacillus]MBP1154048.1 phenylpropionate dioxygenase-like ring-hydroxylating dioxygenase large terminal subunit [Paenibacillus sp. PvP091]MBP1170567.1 phenylpropionate dioxygenase-like ring-hydroxylating dioxygenase large terminal subunit [Paenibacillus sp. PvR098]MBP2441595.1 phenylpropionate dioxygenase-like ring-hydroxylating dioxygenase large terminal subunit [Paenibacillus sp. PvP052]